MPALDENQVVDAVCEHLKRKGYAITSRCSTTQQGIDIVASKASGAPGRILLEAKGGTSSREGSARYQKGFNRTQTFDRVAKGFYTAACLVQAHQHEGDQIALAYPDTEWVRDYLGQIRTILTALQILVFLVRPGLDVVVF